MRSRAGLLALVMALVLPFALAPSAKAQISTATVNGTVRDATGAVIPDAELVITNVETGVEERRRSNSVGVYRFGNLQPGTYTLQASKEGFRTAAVSAFTLVVNQTATFDIAMEVGALTESVTVEALGAELQASSAELGSAVMEQQVKDLPLNGRNFTQLLSLSPGVAPVSVSQNSGGFTAQPIGQFQFPSVNGQTNRSNLFMLDGVINQGQFVSTYAVPPIIDTVQEFKVNSHHDDAEFGGALGGIVNVVSKSGTNELHGTAWWFLRNDALDARNFFRADVVPQRWNQFGASAGGPIVRNKTFYMLGYQGFRLRRPANTLFRVPTQAQINGDLSSLTEVDQILNPFTTREDPNNPGSFITDPFPNKMIPGSMIDPGMRLFAETVLPAPQGLTGVGRLNALDSTPFKQNQEEFTARVDHRFNDNNTIWFRWSGTIQDNEGSGGLPSLASITEYRARNIAGSWVHTFGPTAVMQIQVANTRAEDTARNRFRSLPEGFAGQIGCSNTFCGSFNSGEDLIPNFGVAGWWGGGEANTLNVPSSAINQFKGTATKIIGNHTLKFGGEGNTSDFEAFYENLNSQFRVQQTNSGLASFLLNVNDSAGRRNVHETLRPGGVMSWYIHDSWKARPNLTINLGLRYDRTFQPPYGEEDTIGQQGGIETGALDLLRGVYILQKVPPSCNERGSAPCIPTPDGSLPEHVVVDERGKIYRDTKLNFQPRVGIAYRMTNRTVLRTGFGIFFDNWAGVTQTAQNYEGGWPDVGQQLANNQNLPTSDNPTPATTGTNPFPQGLFPAPTPFNQVLWYIDPLFENPYSMQWNFGLQHQLTGSTVVTANYVGSGSRRLNVGGYYNTALEPGPGPISPRTPFPHAQQSFFDRSWGSSSYNAFQFLLEKRFSEGLAYQVAYTWGRSLDYGASGWFGVEGFAVQNPYRLDVERGPSGFDVPQVLSVNWVWELPFGYGKQWNPSNKILSHIIGGWQFNGIATFRDGQPYQVAVSGDLANVGNTGNYLRPNVAGDPRLSNPTTQRWLNTDAFALAPEVAPGVVGFGNLGRHTERTDGVANFDLSIFRQFPLPGEQRLIEFRAEFFNAFNTPVFGTPQRIMNNPDFGVVSSTLGTAPERQIQFGLKIFF